MWSLFIWSQNLYVSWTLLVLFSWNFFIKVSTKSFVNDCYITINLVNWDNYEIVMYTLKRFFHVILKERWISTFRVSFKSAIIKPFKYFFFLLRSTALLLLLVGHELMQLSTSSKIHVLASPKLIIYFSQNLGLLHKKF